MARSSRPPSQLAPTATKYDVVTVKTEKPKKEYPPSTQSYT